MKANCAAGATVCTMYIGIGIFAVVAVICIFVGATVMKRNRDYGNSEGEGDDFDFDAYEGFDKK
jgi:hypothetical protein